MNLARPALGLGTVQFGQVYGVANKDSVRPSLEDIARILEMARERGIRLLDTAPVYGDCEVLLGRMPAGLQDFRIVTKASRFRNSEHVRHPREGVRATFETSLRDLRRDRLDGLLIHNPVDALADHAGALVEEMESLRARGLVDKIGLSAYEPSDLDRFRYLDAIQLVQLPANILDQRMASSGWLDRLHARAIEIHVRSVFLQGLLCVKPSELPARMAATREPLARLQAARIAASLSAPQACLAYAASLGTVDHVLVGVLGTAQMEELLKAAGCRWDTDFSRFAVDDPAVVDPRKWPPA